MPLHLLIAPDSFKACLSASAVAQAMAEGVRSVMPDAKISRCPLSDGGEGLTDVLAARRPHIIIYKEVAGPAGNTVRAAYAWDEEKRTAIIELAAASGYTLISNAAPSILQRTTRGTGQLMLDALARGCATLLLGLGGSATSDGGVGLLRSIGVRFLDRMGREIADRIDEFHRIASIDTSAVSPLWHKCRIILLCDVDNPFCGPRGAARTFAPQKGANPQEVDCIEAALTHLADLYQKQWDVSLHQQSGAGAAGGTAGSLAATMGATIVRGIDFVLADADFTARASQVDLILTGEGHADAQTLGGKVPHGVLQAAAPHQKPVYLLAGAVDDEALLTAAGFAGVETVTPPTTPLSEALQPECAKANLRRAAAKAVKAHIEKNNVKPNHTLNNDEI